MLRHTCFSHIPFFHSDAHTAQNPPCNTIRTLVPQNIPAVNTNNSVTSLQRCPTHTPGLASTNTVFLVPDHIRKKFMDSWNVHVPLTYLIDMGCLFKDKPAIVAAQELLTIDSITGHIQTSSKPLSDFGKLDLTFDEWHQVWCCLLDLIRTHLLSKLLMWEIHRVLKPS